jgi:predicted ATP-grasp superfamily ATP-dependent carboligase
MKSVPHQGKNDLPPRFVVLGATVTGLALVRAVHRLGGTAVVVDVKDGVAMKSRFATETHAVATGAEELEVLRRHAGGKAHGERPFLLATSDGQLGFVMEHREELTRGFQVLHARNEALRTCLDKALFHQFCAAEGLPVPRFFFCKATAADVRRAVRAEALPLVARLANKSRGAGAFPKLVRVETPADIERLSALADRLHPEDELLLSESLLPRDLVRYSVAFCAARGAFLAFEGIKVRPSAASGQVGTFVTLAEAPEARAIGRRLVERLEYSGVGEIEVFADRATGEHFLIELNARPWVQLNMDRMAGYDFIGFLVGANDGKVGEAGRTGDAWLSFIDDLYYQVSRDGRAEGSRGVSLDYLRSLGRARAWSYFAADDPGPAVAEVLWWLKDVVGSRLRKGKG